MSKSRRLTIDYDRLSEYMVRLGDAVEEVKKRFVLAKALNSNDEIDELEDSLLEVVDACDDIGLELIDAKADVKTDYWPNCVECGNIAVPYGDCFKCLECEAIISYDG